MFGNRFIMVRSRFYNLFAVTAFSVSLACADGVSVEDGEVCALECQPSQSAVVCEVGTQSFAMCGDTLAEAQSSCASLQGQSGPELGLCSTWGDPAEVWTPGSHVSEDLTSGELVIDEDFFAMVTSQPWLLDADSTLVLQGDDGYYELARPGALSDALGWQVGDAFTELNGVELKGITGLMTASATAEASKHYDLEIKRGSYTVVIPYRVD